MKLSRIFLIVFVLAAGIVIFKSFPVIKDRYFPGSQKETSNQTEPVPNIAESSLEQKAEIIKDIESQEEEQKMLKQEQQIFLEIASVNCKAECLGFAGEEFEYCQEVCGLKPIRENVENCDGLENLEKDYCFKDLAVTRKDFEICKEIRDKNISKTCQNRITEEILEDS